MNTKPTVSKRHGSDITFRRKFVLVRLMAPQHQFHQRSGVLPGGRQSANWVGKPDGLLHGSPFLRGQERFLRWRNRLHMIMN